MNCGEWLNRFEIFVLLNPPQIDALEHLGTDPPCETACGDAGCQCKTTGIYPMSRIDHLLMIVDGRVVNCLCGAFSANWLPIALRSWSPVRLVSSVAHYSWSTKGFTFRSSYGFHNDALCGQRTITQHSGETESGWWKCVFVFFNCEVLHIKL